MSRVDDHRSTRTDEGPPGVPLLEVTDLRTHLVTQRGLVRAVDGISLRLQRGRTLGVVGESGSGKTLLGRSIMRLLPPRITRSSGSVSFEGRELTNLDATALSDIWGKEISMVFQDPLTSLNPVLTVGRQIAEVLHRHLHQHHADTRSRAIELLRSVGIPEPERRYGEYPHQLSGGMRQRVMIAMALTCGPKLLLADEPTTALDVTVQAQILDLLGAAQARARMGMILVTHDLGVVAGRTDEILVMYAGRVVEQAPTPVLFADMKMPYTEALLRSAPRLDQPSHAQLTAIPGRPPDLAAPTEGCRFAPRCRYARPRCHQEEPALVEAGSGHWYRCFYPLGAGVQGVRVATRAGVDRGPGAPMGPVPAGRPAAETVGVAAGIAAGTATHRADEALLRVDDLVVEFRARHGRVVHAVSGVSFDIQKGETLGLVGESGCGKSSTGRAIIAMPRPTSGEVRFRGAIVNALSGRELRRLRPALQMIFQDPISSLNPRRQVQDIVAAPLTIWGRTVGVTDAAARRAKVEEVFDAVGLDLDVHGRQRPHQFSGGQCQRISIARALTLDPELLICDEPVAALDVSVQAQILNLLQDMKARYGLTLLFVAHDLAVVKNVSDRVAVMYLGKLVELASPDALYEAPAHHYTSSLLASIPVADPSVSPRATDVVTAAEPPSPLDPPSGCRFRTRCPRAEPKCAEIEPVLHQVADGHFVACHFPLSRQGPGRQEPSRQGPGRQEPSRQPG